MPVQPREGVSEYSLWCHCTSFSLGVLGVYTPGDAGLVWGYVAPLAAPFACLHVDALVHERRGMERCGGGEAPSVAVLTLLLLVRRKVSNVSGQVSRWQDQNKRPP